MITVTVRMNKYRKKQLRYLKLKSIIKEYWFN